MLFGLVGMLVCNGGGEVPPRWDSGDWDDPWWDSGEDMPDCSPWSDIEPDLLDFGAASLGSEPLELIVYNGGDCPLEIYGLELWGEDAAAFELGALDRVLVAPSDQARVSVAFVAEAPGAYSAQVVMDSNDPLYPQQVVDLVAERVEETPLMVLSPTSLDFGEVPLGCAAEMNAELANPSGAALTVNELELMDASGSFTLVAPAPAGVAAGGAELLTLRYAPGDLFNDQAYLAISGDGEPREALLSISGAGLAGDAGRLEATGDGVTERFPLPSPASPPSLQVSLDGVRQDQGWSYEVAEQTVVFVAAPPSSIAVEVDYNEQLPCD